MDLKAAAALDSSPAVMAYKFLICSNREAAMLTLTIDAALDALLACMMRLPALRDCYRPGTPERAALDDLMASLQRTDATLFKRTASAPELRSR